MYQDVTSFSTLPNVGDQPASMDEPAASTAGVPSPAPMEHPCSLEIDVVDGGRGEEEQQIAQVGLVENEVPNEVKI